GADAGGAVLAAGAPLRAVVSAAAGRESPARTGGGRMPRTAQEQQNLDFVLAMYRDVLIPFDSSKVDQYISPDYIQHSSLAPPGREALKQFLDFIRGQSPD